MLVLSVIAAGTVVVLATRRPPERRRVLADRVGTAAVAWCALALVALMVWDDALDTTPWPTLALPGIVSAAVAGLLVLVDRVRRGPREAGAPPARSAWLGRVTIGVAAAALVAGVVDQVGQPGCDGGDAPGWAEAAEALTLWLSAAAALLATASLIAARWIAAALGGTGAFFAFLLALLAVCWN
jgi:hypothetical protein